MRRENLATGEFYHVYNRGVDKRKIFDADGDVDEFLKCMRIFNRVDPIKSIKELEYEDSECINSSPLVGIVGYCLNPTHFHFILEQLVDGGVSEFVKRVSARHTWVYNKRYKRKGALFQGRFKAKHVEDNNYLLHLSCYVNLNNLVHGIGVPDAELVRSSFREYENNEIGMCKKEIILEQFKSPSEYAKYAQDQLPLMLSKRADYKELEDLE